MRQGISIGRIRILSVGVLAVGVLSGCSMPAGFTLPGFGAGPSQAASGDGRDASRSQPASVAAVPGERDPIGHGGTPGEADVDQLAQTAREQAGLIAQAAAEREAERRAAAAREAVQWIDAPVVRGVEVERAPKPQAAGPMGGTDTGARSAAVIQQVDQPGAETVVDRTADVERAAAARARVATPPPPGREELVAMLLADIRSGRGAALDQALSAAGVALLEGEGEIDPKVLAGLAEGKRERVERLRRLIVALSDEVRSPGDAARRDEAVREVSALFEEPALTLRRVVLCRRVSGFGVYDPLASYTMMVGQEHPVIVYAEVDHFRTALTEDKQHRVRLTQEIILYNEADGLAVWQQPRAVINDVSRNRRRDFFVVEMIRLPSRLTVGKYRLKVRVTDSGDGGTDEMTVPIEIVADYKRVADASRALP